MPYDALSWRKRNRSVTYDGQRVALRELHDKKLIQQLTRERCGELMRWGVEVFWDGLGDGWVRWWVSAVTQCGIGDSVAYPFLKRLAADKELFDALHTVIVLTRGHASQRKTAMRELALSVVRREEPPFKARIFANGRSSYETPVENRERLRSDILWTDVDLGDER